MLPASTSFCVSGPGVLNNLSPARDGSHGPGLSPVLSKWLHIILPDRYLQNEYFSLLPHATACQTLRVEPCASHSITGNSD
jgi:hypothetical protein